MINKIIPTVHNNILKIKMAPHTQIFKFTVTNTEIASKIIPISKKK